MFTIPQRIGAAAMVGLAAWAWTASQSAAQQPPANNNNANNQVFRAGPGVGIAGDLPNQGRPVGRFSTVAPPQVQFPQETIRTTIGGRIGTGYGGGGGYGGGFGWGNNFIQDPFSGYLNGGAAVIQAQAQFMVAQQQALLMKQQVQQAKQQTRRAVLDEWLYERANIPSLEQIRQENMALELNRSRNDPPINEILAGTALNNLLGNLEKVPAGGPSVELDPDLLKRINVMPPANGGANFGLLRDGGQLTWPLALRGLQPAAETDELRRQIDVLVQESLKTAADGQQIDAGVLRQIQGNATKLESILKQNIANIPFSQYIDAKRFLNDLEDAQKVLQQADVAKFVNGTYAAKGSTVQELVENMKRQGLRFAPATPGDESAYLALQRLMAQADMTNQALVAQPQR